MIRFLILSILTFFLYSVDSHAKGEILQEEELVLFEELAANQQRPTNIIQMDQVIAEESKDFGKQIDIIDISVKPKERPNPVTSSGSVKNNHVNLVMNGDVSVVNSSNSSHLDTAIGSIIGAGSNNTLNTYVKGDVLVSNTGDNSNIETYIGSIVDKTGQGVSNVDLNVQVRGIVYNNSNSGHIRHINIGSVIQE